VARRQVGRQQQRRARIVGGLVSSVPARRPVGPVYQVGEQAWLGLRWRRAAAGGRRVLGVHPLVDRAQRGHAAGVVVGVHVERIGQRDQGRPDAAQDAGQLALQRLARVRQARIGGNRIVRRVGGAGRRRARRVVAPPVRGQKLAQVAVGKS